MAIILYILSYTCYTKGLFSSTIVKIQQKQIEHRNRGLINYMKTKKFPPIDKQSINNIDNIDNNDNIDNIDSNDNTDNTDNKDHDKVLELNLNLYNLESEKENDNNYQNNYYFVIKPTFKNNYDPKKLSRPVSGFSVSKHIMSFCKDLLQNILPQIRLNGQRIGIENCSIIDVLNFQGSYFPKIHNDLEWTYLSEETPGFQVWYLVQNDHDDKGNMFLSSLASKCGIQQVEMKNDHVVFNINGARWKHNNQPTNNIKPFAIPVSNLDLKYVNTSAGECLVFHKNLLHMSDPRNTRRVAVNFRVAIHNKQGELVINNTKLDNYLHFKNAKLKKIITSIPPQNKQKAFKIGLFDLQ